MEDEDEIRYLPLNLLQTVFLYTAQRYVWNREMPVGKNVTPGASRAAHMVFKALRA